MRCPRVQSDSGSHADLTELFDPIDLPAGMTPDAMLDRDRAQRVPYLRSQGLQLIDMGELNDGLEPPRRQRRLWRHRA